MPKKPYKMHFILMNYKDEPITEVWVDKKKNVKFKNHIDDFRQNCFGIYSTASYEDVMTFLEERCYQRDYQGLGMILRQVGILHYDPYKMCKYFKGRTTADHYWIKFCEDAD